MAASSSSSAPTTPTKSSVNASNKDKIALKLMRVSGQTHTFYFTPAHSASDVAKHVFDSWPENWTEDTVNTHAVLRLIYQGRFLHGNATLGALKIPVGKTTVMHLVSRETLPEPHSQDQQSQEKSGERRCRLCCAIL
ncbi:unnamed protein product [Clavelina lepadiformis]|uniref:UBL3-like ubiquitin domain-containing protein n=1 Tax=Clavelina lepadiformis TaxID=159417 RepID=A0ABP0G3B3_CLALP